MMVGLLDACIKNLKDQGMRRMFLDGVAKELDDFKRLGEFSDMAFIEFFCSCKAGFMEWARYKDVWKDT